MQAHDIASIFPMMGEEDFARLVDDIKANGLREPIWTYQGRIIDGRNRYKACLEAGIEPRFREWDGQGSLVSFVVSLNLSRRHLTSSQKAMIAVEVEPHLEQEGRERQRLAALATNAKRDGTVPEIFQKASTPVEPHYAAQKAATLAGTNAHYVHDAKKIVAQAPELKAAVLSGTLNIPDAKKVSRLPEAQRESVMGLLAEGVVKDVNEARSRVFHEERQAQASAPVLPESIDLIHGDYYEEVKSIGEGSIDLILTDPPYNVASDRVFVFEDRSDISQDFGQWDKYEHQAFIELFERWAQDWQRILRPRGSGYVFTSDSYISYLRDALTRAGLYVKATIIWCKTNPGTQIIHTSFKSSVEYILYFTKGEGGHTFNWQGENEMRNYIDMPICAGNERIKDELGHTLHPTQKPENLLHHLMAISSNPGDTVFDGFMGVGTSAKVALDMGRRFIGIEQDRIFFEYAQRRVAQLDVLMAI